MAETGSPWNSLEAAKLLTGVATPLAIVVMGLIVQSTLAEQDRAWKVQQRLADRRLAVYDEGREPLNRIYCFIADVGTWKDESPDTIVRYKRDVDRVMQTNRSIWSPDTFHAYGEYMNSAFAMFQGIGVDARIKTSDSQKRIGIKTWKREWKHRLTGDVDPMHGKNYERLLDLIARDLMLPAGLQPSSPS